jgi:hypothetical protein
MMSLIWGLGHRLMRLLLLQDDLIDVLSFVPLPFIFFTFLGRCLKDFFFEIGPLRLTLNRDLPFVWYL